jgi:hypothetical protein
MTFIHCRPAIALRFWRKYEYSHKLADYPLTNNHRRRFMSRHGVIGLLLLLLPVAAIAAPLEDRVLVLENAVTALQTQVSNQLAIINNLTSRLVAVESNGALAIGPYVSVNSNDLNGVAGPHVIFEGVNSTFALA